MSKFLSLLLLCSAFLTGSSLPEKPIVVLITSYNNADWYEKNLSKLFEQKYSNYRVIYVDDCSTDGTADLVEAYVKKAGQEHRFTLIRNEENQGALANIFYNVHECDDWDIIVSYDGDDWFYHNRVLSKINKAFSTQNIFLTHGSLITTGGVSDWCQPIPQKNIANNTFRDKNIHCPSHLRTFYAWLFKKIDETHLKHNDEFFKMTWDMAIMYPMIEMAGERHAFIKDILYVYNTKNPLNDAKIDAPLQIFYEKLIRSMPPYHRLNDYEIPPKFSLAQNPHSQP